MSLSIQTFLLSYNKGKIARKFWWTNKECYASESLKALDYQIQNSLEIKSVNENHKEGCISHSDDYFLWLFPGRFLLNLAVLVYLIISEFRTNWMFKLRKWLVRYTSMVSLVMQWNIFDNFLFLIFQDYWQFRSYRQVLTHDSLFTKAILKLVRDF